MSAALQVLVQILNIVVAGSAAIEQLAAIRAQVEAMVAQGRDPTEAEWAGLLADIEALGARLSAADERLNGAG